MRTARTVGLAAKGLLRITFLPRNIMRIRACGKAWNGLAGTAAGSGPYAPTMTIQIRTSLAEPDTGEAFVPHKPVRPEKAEGGKAFKVVSEFEPSGDQPQAIKEL